MQQWAVIQKYIQFNLKIHLLERGLIDTQILLIYFFLFLLNFCTDVAKWFISGRKGFPCCSNFATCYCYVDLHDFLSHNFIPLNCFHYDLKQNLTKSLGFFFVLCQNKHTITNYNYNTQQVHTKVAKSIIFRHSCK